ncbi:DNA helicase [Desulfosarcina ovata subsp. ovata]|uniref:DNA helicase n=2 Tax=Desulfosarcina ovata TaxID=83564 RepID=A0A5K8A3P0_9BACT|nr:DNA helicase [Desulfosarcina ovata subsp. ovata]
MDLLDFTQKLNEEFKKDCVICTAERPWFGHFILETDECRLSYKIGDKKNAELQIIDWRNPLSKGFYNMVPGDYFDMDEWQVEKQRKERYHSISGEVLQQTKIVDRNRTIFQATIQTKDNDHLVEIKDDTYVFLDDVSAYFTSIEGLPDIRSMLTKDQYELITANHLQPLIIQGSAGSGKTTVALYRASWLTYAESARHPVDPKNILIVMFNKALQSFISNLLEPLGIESANLFTFHAWALSEVKKAYKGKIKICIDPFEGEQTAKSIKKQIGILRAIEVFVNGQIQRLYKWVEQKLSPYRGQRWIDDLTQSEQPIVQRLIRLRTKALIERNNAQGREKEELEQIHLLFSQAVKRMTQYKEELLKFLTDKVLLKKHLKHISENEIDTLVRYQKSLQGKDSSPRRPGPFVGFDDLSLILYLIELKNGGLTDKNNENVNLFDHLIIDEAQDFGAIEMTVLLSSVKTRAGVTIVGDINQKIIPEADFMGWEKLAEELGIEGATVSTLEVAHRSTKPIMDLACSVLKSARSTRGRNGISPAITVLSSEEDKIKYIVDILKQLSLTSENQHTCIICRHAKDARPFADMLSKALPNIQIRLGHNKEFEFSPGITVTNMRQIKGLEFDNLIILDPSEENYPNDNQGMKNFYTVITRAKEQLFMVGTEAPTSLMSDAIANGIINFQDQAKVVPIEFTEDEDAPF